MPYELFLAMRYLRSRRKGRLARTTALVAISGITIGVAALVVALALGNSFRDEMRDKILGGTAHLTVVSTDGQPIGNYRELAVKIKSVKGVADVAGTTYDGAVIVGPRGSAYAVLRGIDKESEQAKAEVSQSLIEGEARPIFGSEKTENGQANVVVGAELAARTGLHSGDLADIIPVNTNLSAVSPARRAVRVVGTFRSGLFEYDSTWIYLSLDRAPEFDGERHAAAVIGVHLNDPYAVKEVAKDLGKSLGGPYTIIDWQEANRALFTALSLERRMSLFIIMIIIFIAALNIATTLILVVVERSRDIAIVTAMGATRRSIMFVFMIDGAIIGALGAIIGVVLGTMTCLIGNHYKLVSLPADVYSISYVPFNLRLRDLLLAAVVAFTLSLIATIYPARAAAGVRPVEMLRDAG